MAVGETVGLVEVGEELGLAVGVGVGLGIVGLVVGEVVGLAVVGLAVGVELGLAVVGMPVGVAVGLAVVGARLGASVGPAVGVGVATIMRAARVGAGVGNRLGRSLGNAVLLLLLGTTGKICGKVAVGASVGAKRPLGIGPLVSVDVWVVGCAVVADDGVDGSVNLSWVGGSAAVGAADGGAGRVCTLSTYEVRGNPTEDVANGTGLVTPQLVVHKYDGPHCDSP